MRGKVATGEQRNAHGFEIAITGNADKGPGRRMILRVGAALRHGCPGPVPTEGKHVRQARGFNARHLSDTAKHFIEIVMRCARVE